MSCFLKSLLVAVSLLFLIILGSQSALALDSQSAPVVPPQDKKDGRKQDKKGRKQARKSQKEGAKQSPEQNGGSRNGAPKSEAEEITLTSDEQSKVGELFLYEGFVNAVIGDLRLQADRVTYNDATGDLVAEGNVIFDQGADQRVTARRAEINTLTRRGVFWDTTGFTNRTQTGDYIYFTAERIEKTGPTTYEMFGATVTACEDAVPKWNFTAKRAELKMNDRLKLYSSVFRVKDLPAFVLPYAWIPATRTERKSGFLLPTSGSSNLKGRTFKTAYYQTLGESADITFRNDIYTKRGVGMGAEFRAQTDENSYMRLGVFTVRDRLFGESGEDQSGTAFVAEGVQYLPHGWLAVGNVSVVSSLQFRQVFSDDISQVVDPRRESNFYANNNAGNFSFNLLASNETTRLFRPALNTGGSPDSTAGTDFDIKIRQAPQVDLMIYPRRITGSLPIYFSFDTSMGALKREETVDGQIVLTTPAAVQRFDFKPKITVPLATFAGIAVTPSLALRETFYTSRLDPGVPAFNPDNYSLTPQDPRLDPTSPDYRPGIRLFDPNEFDPLLPENLARSYAELAVDVRPPAFEKLYLNKDGSRRFKHVIEPYLTYRLIKGIGDEFNNIIRFDERDAVANTNEFEYAFVNRFFINRRPSELNRRRARLRRNDQQPDEMEPALPDRKPRRNRGGAKAEGDTGATLPPAAQKPAGASGEAAQKEAARKPGGQEKSEAETASDDKVLKLETGKRDELSKDGQTRGRERDSSQSGRGEDESSTSAQEQAGEDPDSLSNKNAPAQPYEFLSIKVAQKYFFDRTFGGALVEGRRNQFFPINTLSGFTYGGRARSFSPVNVQVRYRPVSALYADVRMDIGADDSAVRNLTVAAGVTAGKVSVRTSYYLSRRIDLDPNRFEPGSFAGNQIVTNVQLGDDARGLYAGTRISYEFTDRFLDDAELSTGRLRHSRSYVGYAFDCCGVQFNYNTFKAGLRNESAFSFTFSLAGIGSFGSDQFSQLGGGRGGRRRGKRARADRSDD